MSVPEDLRNVLEQCLAEDATQDNLELYLPTVRQIITNLLQGLRGKQSIYRRIVSDHRHRSDASGHSRTESRSSRSDRTSRREGSHRSQLSRTITENERPERDSTSRRSAQSSGRRRDPIPQGTSTPNGDEQSVGGFAPSIPEHPTHPQDPDPGDFPNPYESQSRTQRTIPPPIEPPPPPESYLVDQQPSRSLYLPDENPTIPPQSPSAVPASVKRYSLVDKPASTPAVVVEPSSPDIPDTNSSTPPPDTPPLDGLQAPAVATSLAALKKSDALERRASKRFSTYNISKMTGVSTTRDRSLRGGHPSRRSLLAVSSALTPGELAVLTEVDDDEPSPAVKREGSSRSRRSVSRPSTPDRQVNPPVPPLPSTPARTPEPTIAPSAPATSQSEEASQQPIPEEPVEPPSDGSRLSVFLQLGREVKKATIEPGLSFSSLRMLFVDKFSYNPGLENFPAIYIRDPSSGVQYELEDMDEVKEKCLLSLNIERRCRRVVIWLRILMLFCMQH